MAAPGPELLEELVEAGRAAGLSRVGVCAARSWSHTRGLLEARRAEGRAGTMAFTYRRPARSADPSRIVGSARSIVVGALAYAQPVGDPPSPTAARVARYATSDHYGRLDAALRPIADRLRARGHRGVIVRDDNALVDREAAWRAGIGSYGKNANLMLPGGGSWFVLGAVVTDAELPTTGPPVADQCGSCRRCLDRCPTGAIVAPGVVDASRCLAWVLQAPEPIPVELRTAVGDRLYGCDDCQEVCPPARRAEAAAEAPGPAADPGSFVSALELLAASDDELLRRFGRWYLPGRDPSVLRRNLLVVLGNSGAGDEPGVAAVLARYAAGDDPALAEHARWAIDRLAGGQLAGEQGPDEDGRP